MLQVKVSRINSVLYRVMALSLLAEACCLGMGDAPSVKWLACCVGGYSASKALERAREQAARDRKSAVQFIMVLPDLDIQRAGTSEGVSYEVALKQLFLGDSRATRATLFLQTPDGSAVDHWDGSTGGFSRTVLSGKNPFRLTKSIELANLEWRPGNNSTTSLSEWQHTLKISCLSSNPGDPTEDTELIQKLRGFFGRRPMIVTIGNSPYFGDLLNLVHMIPVQGWHSPPATKAEIKTRQLDPD